jgi:hypothetical protein
MRDGREEMAQLLRFLWRFDFDVSYAFFDRRGQALQILATTVPDFLQNFTEGDRRYSFVAESTQSAESRQLAVEPTSINGTLRWRTGTSLERVLQHSSFRASDRICKELMRICEVTKIQRAGLRLMFVDGIANERSRRDRFASTYDEKVIERAEATLGPINDLGAILEGTTHDRLGYRVHFGPAARRNLRIALDSWVLSEEELKDFDKYALFYDIDIFERGFELLCYKL